MFISPVGGSLIQADVTAASDSISTGNERSTSSPFLSRSSITSASEHATCLDPCIPKTPKTSDGSSYLDTIYMGLLAYNRFSNDRLRDLGDEEKIALNLKLRYFGDNMFVDYDRLSDYEDVYYSLAERFEKLGFPKN